jgi:hypothetical protein
VRLRACPPARLPACPQWPGSHGRWNMLMIHRGFLPGYFAARCEHLCARAETQRGSPRECVRWSWFAVRPAPHVSTADSVCLGGQRLQVGPAALDVSSPGTQCWVPGYFGTYTAASTPVAMSVGRPLRAVTEAVDRVTVHGTHRHSRSTTFESSVRVGSQPVPLHHLRVRRRTRPGKPREVNLFLSSSFYHPVPPSPRPPVPRPLSSLLQGNSSLLTYYTRSLNSFSL